MADVDSDYDEVHDDPSTNVDGRLISRSYHYTVLSWNRDIMETMRERWCYCSCITLNELRFNAYCQWKGMEEYIETKTVTSDFIFPAGNIPCFSSTSVHWVGGIDRQAVETPTLYRHWKSESVNINVLADLRVGRDRPSYYVAEVDKLSSNTVSSSFDFFRHQEDVSWCVFLDVVIDCSVAPR